MTLGTTVFFNRLSLALDFTAARAIVLFAVLAVFFCAAGEARFVSGFFALAFDATDLTVANLEDLRPVGFEPAALFALGLADLVCIERPLREDFGDDRRVGVCDLDPLMPFVTGLLITRFRVNADRAAGSGGA